MLTSAGIIVYRKTEKGLEFLLGHPGGPYNKNNQMYLPIKGGVEEGESYQETAIREFREETGVVLTEEEKNNLIYLGNVKQSKHKTIHFFCLEKTIDENKCYSNKAVVEYPPKSGINIEVSEVDHYKWFNFEELIATTHPTHIIIYEKIVNWHKLKTEQTENVITSNKQNKL